MRRILVAIDGSEIARRAVDFAASQAALLPVARLHLLMVKDPVHVYGEASAYASEQVLQADAAADCREILKAAGARVPKAVPVDLELLEGQPATTIVRRATQLGCESIVMGTHGRGRLELVLLGSVAQKVVHTSRVPVTLVQ